jgi:2-keto-3-deoxy-L-fuconate dehydrogenase
MSGRLQGKTAVVTAAAQGIGRATAIAFAKEGAQVWATDINEGLLNRLQQEVPGLNTSVLDVRDAKAISEFAQQTSTIDVLMNCAGYVHNGTILECFETDWDFSFDLNVKSMYRMCRTFLPGMLQAGKGSIVNISSVVSVAKSAPSRFVYQSTKAAVVGLTKAIALDFVRQGIRCNAICPGTVQSPSLENRMAAKGDLEAVRAEFAARQPMQRLGKPEEIAALAVYLASDESSFTTGQAHIIDGGWAA